MKTWQEKFETLKTPQIKILDKAFADMPIHCKMLIATPEIVDTYVRAIPKGTRSTFQAMRNDLAITFNADKTCPVTTGIFLRGVYEVAYATFLMQHPTRGSTSFWRFVDLKSPLAKKLSFGTDFIVEQLRKEKIIL
jgi:hypothetical protein